MQPDEIERSANAAQDYLNKQMEPADLVSVVSLGDTIMVNQDFTSDRDKLKAVLQSFNAGAGAGFELGSTGTTEGTADTGQSFTVDDTEYNIFNTDRRLQALRAVAEQVANVPQKKSLIYFSSGMQRTGIENQSQLRAAINAAVLANLSIYTMDIRGLQALPPGGEAQSASLRGTSAYSGRSQMNALDSNFQTQETLVTLAADTGGKAFLDSNDFGRVFKGVQDDTSMYYLLGYHSTNTAKDGRYRRIYGEGEPSRAEDRFPARLLRRGRLPALRQRRSRTAVAGRAGVGDAEHRSSGVSGDRVLPRGGQQILRSAVADRAGVGDSVQPQSRQGQSHARHPRAGQTEEKKFPVGEIRDTVKLAVNASSEVQRKNVQYDTGLTLLPGKYHLKVVVRENEAGRMGSFETDFTIPDLKSSPLKMSSIVMASQLQAAPKKDTGNPLVQNGQEIVPSVTRVFSSNSTSTSITRCMIRRRNPPPKPARRAGKRAKPGVRVMSNVAFFQGDAKAYETPLVKVQEITVRRDARRRCFNSTCRSRT